MTGRRAQELSHATEINTFYRFIEMLAILSSPAVGRQAP